MWWWERSVWFGEKEEGFEQAEVAQDVPMRYRESHLGSNTGKIRRPVYWLAGGMEWDGTLSLAWGQYPDSKGGKTTPFFWGESRVATAHLVGQIFTKIPGWKLLSEIFRSAGTKPHITHQELHLVLPLGPADVAKSFPHHSSFHIVFSVPAVKSGLLWDARKSAEHHPSSAFS